jgi:tetratricopeptide (TPR) repeat protein
MSFSEDAKHIEQRLKSIDNPVGVRAAVEEAVALAGPWADESNLLQAAELLERAVDAAQDIEDSRLAAYVLDQKAYLLTQFDLPSEGLEALQRAVQLVGPEDPLVQRDLKVRRTVVLAKLGRLPEAIDELEKILGTIDSAEEDERYASLLGLLGNFHLRAGKNQEADELFRKAISLTEGRGNPSSVVRLQLGLSQALAGQEEYREAQSILLEQLSVASTNELALDTWDLLAPAIEVSHQMQDWPTLAKLTNQAIELSSRQGNYKEANMHRENLISVLMRQGEMHQAKAQLEIALEYARRKGPAERKLVHLMSLGRVCFEVGELKSSKSYYQEALEAAERQGNQRSVITILGRLGALLAEREDLEGALNYGERAVRLAEEVEDPLILAEQLVLLALTYRDMNFADKSAAASERAAELYQQQGEAVFAERALQLHREVEHELQAD